MRSIDEYFERHIQQILRRLQQLEADDRPVILTGSKTYNWPSLSSGSQQETTVTVTGAAVGDFVIGVSMSVSPLSTTFHGQVTAANTVTVLQYNLSGVARDVAEGTLRVRVMKI